VIEQLKTFIADKSLIAPHDRILLAVSGGLDSMVMLYLFHQLNIPIGVAHANFQLRGDASHQDEWFVKHHAASRGLPFFSKRFETNNYAIEHKISIQMAARQLRYSWFDELMQEGFTKVATAHHFNDSIETMLMNWLRGGGIESLHGIAARRENIIRPLLFATRAELEEYAAHHQITWREDISNQHNDYLRNIVRHQVLPKLNRINPSLEKTLMDGHRKAEGELLFFQKSLSEWKEKNVRTNGGYGRISKSVLRDDYSASVLYHCLREVGFDFESCLTILRTLDAQSGKIFYSRTHQLVIDRTDLVISPIPPTGMEVLINEGDTKARLGSAALEIAVLKEWGMEEEASTALLDADKIEFPIRWRQWRAGDYFYPLGMKHHKKVSDFLIDKKVSRAEKDTVTVLESQGDIVWVAGFRIDERYKITDRTRRVLAFRLLS
jgi:tRNA(Ile)-lysidine synthase